MGRKNTPNASASRRRVLSAAAGAGVSALLASVASNPADAELPDEKSADAELPDEKSADATVVPTPTDLLDVLSLGTFESGLDGWETDDATDLARVEKSDRPVAVTEGENALEVSVGGGSSPSISRSVESLGLATHPYFVGDVAPGRVEGTDAPVAFRFRLYRPPDLLEGRTDPVLVAESDPVTVRQAAPGRIFWDASDVDAGLLGAGSRLEVVWYPTDHPPDDDADDATGTTDEFEYRGSVVFDAIRATDSADAVGTARLAATMTELQFDHGPYRRTEITAESDTAEEGAFVFADGETEPYRFEILAADRFRMTVSGTAVKLGGEW